MSQLALMIAVSLLVGLASAGIVWFGTDLGNKLTRSLKVWLHQRKLKAEAEAQSGDDATDEDER